MAALFKRRRWLGIVLVALAAVVAYQYFGLGKVLTLDALKGSRETLGALYRDRPLTTVAVYFTVYVLAAALSFPGATILTLAAGAMFGLGLGLVVVSFASSVGRCWRFWPLATCCATACNRASARYSRRSTRACGATAPSTCSH